MKSERELRELAEKHGIEITVRRWFERRNEAGQWETAFIDLPRPRGEIADDLRDLGAFSRES